MDESRTRSAEGDRNAASRALTAVLAHEVNNPLTAILGHMQLILDAQAYPTGSGLAEELAQVEAAARRIASTLKEFRRWASAEEAQGEEADLTAAVRAGVRSFEARQEARGIPVRLAEPPIPQLVHANSDLLEKLIESLLLNLLKAIPDGGAIEVAVEAGSDSEVACRIGAGGAGLTRPEFERALEPEKAARVEPGAARGSGLRLYVPRCILRHYDGTLVLESAPGRGSALVVVLPRAARSNADGE